jgi:hypothetical protein
MPGRYFVERDPEYQQIYREVNDDRTKDASKLE